MPRGHRIGFLLGIVLAAFALASSAAAQCLNEPEQVCDLTREVTCPVITLGHWIDADGGEHCERLLILVPPTQILPQLRHTRCTVNGDDTEIAFTASNFLPSRGPRSGDVLQLRGSLMSISMSGEFKTLLEPSKVWLQNIGPGRSLIVKCRAFGPG